MNRLKSAAKYALLLLGSATLAFGLFNVHSQSGITEGGVLGLTLLLKNWFNISPSVAGIVIDGICYIIGFKLLGKAFLKYSIVASLGFAGFYALFERLGPILPSMAHLPFLAAVIGGLFVGVGCGINVSIGGAAGGDDALAMSISKVTKCSISKAYLLTDLTVLLMSLSYIPLTRIIYSLITVTISSFLIGKIQRINFFPEKVKKTEIL